MSAVVLLDRDGVLNRDLPGSVTALGDLALVAGADRAVALLSRAGYAVLVITNQAAVGRGQLSGTELTRINDQLAAWVAAAGGRLDRFYVCPHAEEAGCPCRKPKPGLIEQAAGDWGFVRSADLVRRRCRARCRRRACGRLPAGAGAHRQGAHRRRAPSRGAGLRRSARLRHRPHRRGGSAPEHAMSQAHALAILRQHQEAISGIEPLLPALLDFAARLVACLERGGTVLWMGNGGSAGDAQHLSAELIGRFQRERRALRSLALSTDTSLMTAVANDYGFEQIFARQLEALAGAGDVVVAISTSGGSRNVCAGAAVARRRGATVVALTGQGGGALGAECDLLIAVPSRVTARVQEAHILIGHLVCELVDEHIAAHPQGGH